MNPATVALWKARSQHHDTCRDMIGAKDDETLSDAIAGLQERHAAAIEALRRTLAICEDGESTYTLKSLAETIAAARAVLAAEEKARCE